MFPEWKESRVSSADELKASLEAVGRSDFGMETMVKMLISALLNGRYRSAYKTVDNEMLKLGTYSEEDLEAEFEKKFK